MFKEIGNTLGYLIEGDSSYLTSRYMGMAHILVRMNSGKGLVDMLTIKWGIHTFKKSLDYEGVPFYCGHCHSHGHLGKNCKMGPKKLKWVRRDLGDDEATQAQQGIFS